MDTIIALIIFPVSVLAIGLILILMANGIFDSSLSSGHWLAAIIHLIIFAWGARSTGKYLWKRLVVGEESGPEKGGPEKGPEKGSGFKSLGEDD